MSRKLLWETQKKINGIKYIKIICLNCINWNMKNGVTGTQGSKKRRHLRKKQHIAQILSLLNNKICILHQNAKTCNINIMFNII